MALDFFAGSRRDKIDPHEEGLLELGDGQMFPQLHRLFEQFYESPKIEPTAAGALVHELLHLRHLLLESKEAEEHVWLAPVLVRLACFFSHAYREQITVNSQSD